MDERFKDKTYEELYKRDLQHIRKDILDDNTPFNFEYNHEWTYNGLWIGDAIQQYVNPILNPNNYVDFVIEELEKMKHNLFTSENNLFSTNLGDVNAKYCYINKKFITFYDKNKKQVASIKRSKIYDLMNERGYIIDE